MCLQGFHYFFLRIFATLAQTIWVLSDSKALRWLPEYVWGQCIMVEQSGNFFSPFCCHFNCYFTWTSRVIAEINIPEYAEYLEYLPFLGTPSSVFCLCFNLCPMMLFHTFARFSHDFCGIFDQAARKIFFVHIFQWEYREQKTVLGICGVKSVCIDFRNLWKVWVRHKFQGVQSRVGQVITSRFFLRL